MVELQRFLFENKPSRRELLSYVPTSEREFSVCVYRNHSFELVEHTIGAYLDFAGCKCNFSYSDYDDSLTFFNIDKNADIFILWLDLGRYKQDNLSAFIKLRIGELKKIFKKPIIFIPVNGMISLDDPTVVTLDVSPIKNELGDRFLDERLEGVSGTKLSSAALLRISKELGLRYLPACAMPALKAIVVDLDNTLYRGVLGEDGIDGIVLTEGHIRFQKLLKEKSAQGWFLCVASKNEKSDVLEMFEKRVDFPLKKSDFTVIEASWSPKSESMKSILQVLNIGVDSILFVDDNIGELAQMSAAFPSIKVLHAEEDADLTANILSYYPGLLKVDLKAEDALRMFDVQANAERNKMQTELSKTDYVKSLEIKLVYYVDDVNFAPRIAELANKTNQFIFNYKRYTLEQVYELMVSKNAVVVSATLSDKLSDSGTIAVCVGIKEGDCMVIEECFVSCRALGRGIDDILLLGMMETAQNALQTKELKVLFRKGERNTPAENFVNSYLKKYENKSAVSDLSYDRSVVDIQIKKG